MDPIGIEPTTSTLPVEQRTIVSRGQTQGETASGVLVSPMVSPSEHDLDPQTAELAAIWQRLSGDQREQALEWLRTKTKHASG